MTGAYDPDRVRPGGASGAGRWTSTLAGMMATAGGLFARAAVALVGLAVIVGPVAPRRQPDPRARPDLGDQVPRADTIALTIPEGKLSRTLTLVDGAGRDLAILTCWADGEVAVVSRRGDGPGVSWWSHDRTRTAFIKLFGTSRETYIDLRADGTTRTIAKDPSAGP